MIKNVHANVKDVSLVQVEVFEDGRVQVWYKHDVPTWLDDQGWEMGFIDLRPRKGQTIEIQTVDYSGKQDDPVIEHSPAPRESTFSKSTKARVIRLLEGGQYGDNPLTIAQLGELADLKPNTLHTMFSELRKDGVTIDSKRVGTSNALAYWINV